MKMSYEVKRGQLLWLLSGLLVLGVILSAVFLIFFSVYAMVSKTLNVIIISPYKGQHVSVSKSLLISGISSSNRTNNCKVYIIINNIKPYQKTNATGHNGPNDYSTWVYRLSFPYPPLKLGENKITAKITCTTKNHARFNTVNVTGVQ